MNALGRICKYLFHVILFFQTMGRSFFFICRLSHAVALRYDFNSEYHLRNRRAFSMRKKPTQYFSHLNVKVQKSKRIRSSSRLPPQLQDSPHWQCGFRFLPCAWCRCGFWFPTGRIFSFRIWNNNKLFCCLPEGWAECPSSPFQSLHNPFRLLDLLFQSKLSFQDRDSPPRQAFRINTPRVWGLYLEATSLWADWHIPLLSLTSSLILIVQELFPKLSLYASILIIRYSVFMTKESRALSYTLIIYYDKYEHLFKNHSSKNHLYP